MNLEKRRYKRERREERKCWFGCGVVKHERHFLQRCSTYNDIKKDTIEELGKKEFEEKGIEIMLGGGNEAEIK